MFSEEKKDECSGLNNQDIAISVQGLGKCYQIYDRPSDRLKQMLVRSKRRYFREFWALKDVSFSVKRGETVGIIGRNGSGKSTILQMICGTLTPTTGSVNLNGKVAALLELGAGFNPEFTGRENVYMAASIYGLTREQIDARFAKIVEFADIGEHLEQPVKTYSSGMYVRLAFAVIAHVDADILVIDEALAVGDAVFTQKCMRFIRRFKETGTLLFVSHDMSSVLNLCETTLWLDGGQLREYGKAKEVGDNYLRYTLQEVYGEEAKLDSVSDSVSGSVSDSLSSDSVAKSLIDYEVTAEVKDNLSEANGWKTGSGEITKVEIRDGAGTKLTVCEGGERVRVTITAKLYDQFQSPILGFILKDRLGQDLFGENTLVLKETKGLVAYEAGSTIEAYFEFTLPMLPNGSYVMMCSLAEGSLQEHIQHHYLHDALVLNVSSSKVRWGLVGIRFNSIQLVKVNENII